ncbi:MBL fold metallo-hydrolase [Lentibacillus daqui]|uniref:MBL fold metallo-hydrolase n=2 Tax=Lentibacillus TaxID=175304 RepID=UPI0022B205D5|nr:MBL fold metallo-hydrolase [Lentibacillus daqui]
MKLKKMSLGPLGTNCYLIFDKERGLIIDPGGDADQVIAFLKKEGIKPVAILLTHAHFDHIGAVDELRNHYGIDVYLHDMEADWLENPQLNGSSSFIGQEIKTKGAEQSLKPGELMISGFRFQVLHTPGHSPGSVSFVFYDEKIVFGGDALFQQGIGRTDLPGGNYQQLINSIQERLYSLDDTFTVYPGHGPKTTIGEEKRLNPFVQA